jgi:putative (di)nucleoside polyphosphate hydrolase
MPAMPRFEDLPYRPCVGVALFNRAGRVFVGRRKGPAPEHVDATHAWQMPQGGIDEGEEPLTAAIRELYEETNVRSARLIAEAPEWFAYDLPPDIAGQAWKGRYRGQTQKWFAFRFEGEDSEIDVASPGGGRHKPEFDAWRWEALEATPALIIPFKRPVYDRVAEAFRPFAHPV